MSDLISRDELLKKFSVNSNGDKISEYDIDNFLVTIALKDVKEMIRKQPTVSEQEIRDKTIEEFTKRLNEKCNSIIAEKWCNEIAPVSWANAYADFKDDVDEIAEQMKEVGE